MRARSDAFARFSERLARAPDLTRESARSLAAEMGVPHATALEWWRHLEFHRAILTTGGGTRVDRPRLLQVFTAHRLARLTPAQTRLIGMDAHALSRAVTAAVVPHVLGMLSAANESGLLRDSPVDPALRAPRDARAPSRARATGPARRLPPRDLHREPRQLVRRSAWRDPHHVRLPDASRLSRPPGGRSARRVPRNPGHAVDRIMTVNGVRANGVLAANAGPAACGAAVPLRHV